MEQIYIGLNLHYCIPYLESGIILLEQVKKLIIGHTCTDKEGWEKTIAAGMKYHWAGLDESKIRAIISTLRTQGKIEQPILRNKEHYPIVLHGVNGVVWVTDEDDIVWADA